MRSYRVYFITRGAPVRKPPIDIQCTNDFEASKKPQQLVDGHDTELWEDDRWIGSFSYEK